MSWNQDNNDGLEVIGGVMITRSVRVIEMKKLQLRGRNKFENLLDTIDHRSDLMIQNKCPFEERGRSHSSP